MKNFRKVLALVLVVATLFSFASMAGAKSLADYEDADKVSYANANEDLSTKLSYCPFHEIRVEGNVITWVEDCTHTDSDCVISDIEGAQVANDALIMVVYPVSGGYKAVKMTAAEFDAWRSEWGWAQGDAWATVSGGKVTELVVLATKLADKP